MSSLSAWLVPLMLVLIPFYALLKGVDVYSVFCRGAADGIKLVLKILPYILAMLVAIEVFCASGAMDILLDFLAKPAARLGLPAEILPLGLLRSISGSGAMAMAAQLMAEHGADSFIGRVAAAMQGSTDTTLYVLAVYFGAAGITRQRHALPVGLLADAAAFVAAFLLCRLLFA